MPIDSKVVNGQFVFEERISDAVLAIQDGVFVSDEEKNGDGAWRTINASGYFVFPGLIQPACSSKVDELSLALQGITTMIPVFDSMSTEELAADIASLKSCSRINYLPCWELPARVSQESLSFAADQGIRVFNVEDASYIHSLSEEIKDCTVRVDGSSPNIEDLITEGDDYNIVVLIQSSDDLEQFARSSIRESVYVEISLDVLLDDADIATNGQIPDSVDIVTVSSDPVRRPLLPVLYHQFYANQPDSLSKISRLTAVNPASAYGLSSQKASFMIGTDADFFVFDAERSDNWNGSEWLGRVIFSQAKGDILLYNEAIDVLPGQAIALA